MLDFEIVIPTRDSASYIGVFLQQYRRFRLDPIYVVDGRTQDDTVGVLAGNHARVHVVLPKGDFGVTELVEAGFRVAKNARWVLRLDDDEFPTRAMLGFVAEKARESADCTYSFSREWVVMRKGRPTFYRIPRFYCGNDHYDLQHRMILNEGLAFDHQIHTVGIDHVRPLIGAPPTCFVAHFDCLLKSADQQLAKVRRYETIEEGSAWRYADLYLPHLFTSRSFEFHHRQMEEFAELNQQLRPPTPAHPPLSRSELKSIRRNCSSSLAWSHWWANVFG